MLFHAEEAPLHVASPGDFANLHGRLREAVFRLLARRETYADMLWFMVGETSVDKRWTRDACVVEAISRPGHRFFVAMDMVFAKKHESEEQWDHFARRVCATAAKAVGDSYPLSSAGRNYCQCSVLYMNGYLTKKILGTETTVYTRGIHIVWPRIIVDQARAECMARLIDEHLSRDIPRDLAGGENTWKNAIDMQAYVSGLRMPGCPEITPCAVCRPRALAKASNGRSYGYDHGHRLVEYLLCHPPHGLVSQGSKSAYSFIGICREMGGFLAKDEFQRRMAYYLKTDAVTGHVFDWSLLSLTSIRSKEGMTEPFLPRQHLEKAIKWELSDFNRGYVQDVETGDYVPVKRPAVDPRCFHSPLLLGIPEERYLTNRLRMFRNTFIDIVIDSVVAFPNDDLNKRLPARPGYSPKKTLYTHLWVTVKGEGSHFCHHKNGMHARSSIRFSVDYQGYVSQGCWCKKTYHGKICSRQETERARLFYDQPLFLNIFQHTTTKPVQLLGPPTLPPSRVDNKSLFDYLLTDLRQCRYPPAISYDHPLGKDDWELLAALAEAHPCVHVKEGEHTHYLMTGSKLLFNEEPIPAHVVFPGELSELHQGLRKTVRGVLGREETYADMLWVMLDRAMVGQWAQDACVTEAISTPYHRFFLQLDLVFAEALSLNEWDVFVGNVCSIVARAVMQCYPGCLGSNFSVLCANGYRAQATSETVTVYERGLRLVWHDLIVDQYRAECMARLIDEHLTRDAPRDQERGEKSWNEAIVMSSYLSGVRMIGCPRMTPCVDDGILARKKMPATKALEDSTRFLNYHLCHGPRGFVTHGTESIYSLDMISTWQGVMFIGAVVSPQRDLYRWIDEITGQRYDLSLKHLTSIRSLCEEPTPGFVDQKCVFNAYNVHVQDPETGDYLSLPTVSCQECPVANDDLIREALEFFKEFVHKTGRSQLCGRPTDTVRQIKIQEVVKLQNFIRENLAKDTTTFRFMKDGKFTDRVILWVDNTEIRWWTLLYTTQNGGLGAIPRDRYVFKRFLQDVEKKV